MTEVVGAVAVELQLSREKFDRSMAQLRQMGDLSFKISPVVDHKPLDELNRHLDRKQQHFQELNRYFASNPLTPRIDLRGLDQFERRLQSLKNQTVSVSVVADTSAAQSQIESFYSNATRDIVARVKIAADFEIKEQQRRVSEESRFRKESDSRIIEELRAIRDASKQSIGGGVVSGIGQQFGFLIGQRLLAGLDRNFGINIKAKIDAAIDETALPIKILFTENPAFRDELNKAQTILGERLKNVGYLLGDGIVAAIDQEGATVAQRLQTFFDSAFKTEKFKQQIQEIKREIVEAGGNVGGSIVRPENIQRIVPQGVSSALSSYREQALIDRAIPLVQQRAQEELQAARINRRSSGRVVDESTNELVIATGGYAGARGLSGARISQALNEDRQLQQAGVKSIFVKNAESDISPEARNSQPTKLMQALGFDMGPEWIAGISKSLARPNLRGYSNDSVEMAAQALAALEKNPEIKIKFLGESGGGFVAEEAAKILQLMGYKNVEYLGVGTPEYIGGLNAPGKKILSPDEEVGKTNANLARMGLINPAQMEATRGVTRHLYDNYKGTAEYRNFLYGMAEPPTMEQVQEVSRQADLNNAPEFRQALRERVSNGNLSAGNVADSALANYEEARRMMAASSEELKPELERVAAVYRDIYTEFAKEPFLIATIRRRIEATKKELIQLQRRPGLDSGVRADNLVSILKSDIEDLERESKRLSGSQDAYVGTLADKQKALTSDIRGLISELSAPSLRVRTDSDLAINTRELIENLSKFGNDVQRQISEFDDALKIIPPDSDIGKDLESIGNRIASTLADVDQQIAVIDDVIGKTTGKAQEKYKGLSETLKTAKENLQSQSAKIGVQQVEASIASSTGTGLFDFFDQPELTNEQVTQYQKERLAQLQQPGPSKAFIPDPFASRQEQMMQRGQSIVSRLRDRFFGGGAEQQVEDAGSALALAGQQGGALSVAGTATTNLIKTVLRLAGTKAEEVAVARINELLARTPGQPGVITVNPRRIERISDLTPFDVGRLSRLGFEDVGSALGPIAGLAGGIGRGGLQGLVQGYAALQGAERGVLSALPFGQAAKSGLKLAAGAGGALMLANAVPGGQMALGAATDAIQGGLAIPGNALAQSVANQITDLVQQALSTGRLSPENLGKMQEFSTQLKDLANQVQNFPKIGNFTAETLRNASGAVNQFVQVVENVPGNVGAAAQQLLSTINALVTGGAATVLAPVAAGAGVRALAGKGVTTALDAAGVDTTPLALPASRADAFTLPPAREKLALPAGGSSREDEPRTIVVQAQQVVDVVLDKFNQFSNSLEGAKEKAKALPAGNQVIDVVAKEVSSNYEQTVEGFTNRIREIGREFNIANQRAAGDPKAAGAVQNRILTDLTDLEKDLRTALNRLRPAERTGTTEGRQLANLLSQVSQVRNDLIAEASGRRQISASPDEPVKIAEVRTQLKSLGESFKKLASSAKSFSDDSTQKADSLRALIQEAERARELLDAIEREGGITSKTDPTTRKRIASARTQITNAVKSANETAQAAGIDLTETGAAIPEGIGKGVKDNITGLAAIARNLSEQFKEVVEREFGISSPSRWGIYIGEMIAVGINTGLQLAKGVVGRLSQSLQGAKKEVEESSIPASSRNAVNVSARVAAGENITLPGVFGTSNVSPNAVSRKPEKTSNQPTPEGESADKLAKSGEKINGVFGLIGKGVESFKAAVSGVENSLNNLIPGVGNLGTNLKLAAGGFIAFQVAGQIIPILNQFVKGAIDAAISLDRLKTGLNFAVGGSAQGARDLKFVRDTVDQLGIPLDAAQKGFVQLAAAAKGTAIEGETVKGLFEGVSKASTVLGLSAEDTQGIFLALSQVISKGKASAEEIRQQLAERLPGAFSIFARSAGVSEAEFSKLLETGSVLSEDILPKFQKELNATFGGSAGDASKNLQSSFFRLGAAFQKIQEGFGRVISPAVQVGVDGLTNALKVLAVVIGPMVGIVGKFGLAFLGLQIGPPIITAISASLAGLTISASGVVGALGKAALALKRLLISSGPLILAFVAIEAAFKTFEAFQPTEAENKWKSFSKSTVDGLNSIAEAADRTAGKLGNIKPPVASNRLADQPDVPVFSLTYLDDLARIQRETKSIEQQGSAAITGSNAVRDQLRRGVIKGNDGTEVDIRSNLQEVSGIEAELTRKRNQQALLGSSKNPDDKARFEAGKEEVKNLEKQLSDRRAAFEAVQSDTDSRIRKARETIEEAKKSREDKINQGLPTSTEDTAIKNAEAILKIEQEKKRLIDEFNKGTRTSVGIAGELNAKFAEVSANIALAKERAQFFGDRQLLQTRGTDPLAAQRANVTRIQTQRQSTELGIRELQNLFSTNAAQTELGSIQDPTKPNAQGLTLNTDRAVLERALKNLPDNAQNASRRTTLQNLIQLRQLQESLPGLQLQESDANQAVATGQLDLNAQRRGLAIRQNESASTVDLRRRQRLFGLRDTDVAVSQAQIGLSNTTQQIDSTTSALSELDSKFKAGLISSEEYTKRNIELTGQLADLKKQKAEQELSLQDTISKRALDNLDRQTQKVQDQIQRGEANQIVGLRRRQRRDNLNPEDVAIEEQKISLQTTDKRLAAEQAALEKLAQLRATGALNQQQFEERERQALNNLSDLKKTKAEQELALQNAINQRIIENLQRANQLAEAIIKATTTQRITDIKQFALLPGAGEATDQAIGRASGVAEDEAARKTLALKKVELEQNRRLFAERRINQKTFQDTEIRLNQEILDLNQQRVDKSAALERQLRDARIRYVEEASKASERSIGREIELLRARQGLVQARSQAGISALEGQLGQTDRQLGLAQRLRDPNLDPTIAAEIRKQTGGASEEELLKRKFDLENEIAARRENASAIEYENQKRILDLEFKKNVLAAEREQREARRAQLDAEQGQLVARDTLNKALKSGDSEAISNAQKGVQIANEIKAISDIGVDQAAEGIQQAKDLYQIEKDTLDVKRAQTVEEEKQAAIRRGQDQRLTLVENRVARQDAGIPAFADGGIAQGLSLVGERGPELAIFNQPTQILPAEVTRRILSDVSVNMDSTKVSASITPNVSLEGFKTDMAFHLMRMADAAERMGNAQWNQSNNFTVMTERESALDEVLKLHRGVLMNRFGG